MIGAPARTSSGNKSSACHVVWPKYGLCSMHDRTPHEEGFSRMKRAFLLKRECRREVPLYSDAP